MMKILSIVAAAGMAAAAAEETSPIGGGSIQRLDGYTTEQLETDTRQFIETHLMNKRRLTEESSNNGKVDSKEKEQQKKRTLQKRQGNRNGKGGKNNEWHSPSWDGPRRDGDRSRLRSSSRDRRRRDDDDDDGFPGLGGSGLGSRLPRNRSGGGGDWHGGGGKSGKSGSGKWGGSGSGKSGKWHGSSGGKWDDDGHHHDDDYRHYDDDDYDDDDRGWLDDDRDWPHKELFYILPTACPDECISSMVSRNNEMIDSLVECDVRDDAQLWMIQSDGSYIMIRSYDDPQMCIAVDYEEGDDKAMAAATCFNGELMLKPCRDTEYGTEWYFTGGQLVNTFCWGAGLSSYMTIFVDEKEGKVIKECKKDVAVWGAVDEAILKADTFMFVNHLPETPFFLDVDEVLDGKEPKMTDNSNDRAVDRETEG